MIDKRVIDRQLRRGTLNAAEYQRTLDALPDISDRISREPIREPAPREPAPREAAPAPEAPRTNVEPVADVDSAAL